MATKSIVLSNSYQLVTNKQSYIHLKSLVTVEYHTGDSEEPSDEHATIVTNQDIAYSGGDNLYMRLKREFNGEARITVDEVAL